MRRKWGFRRHSKQRGHTTKQRHEGEEYRGFVGSVSRSESQELGKEAGAGSGAREVAEAAF